MSWTLDGIPASPGIVMGPAYVLRWDVPRVPPTTVPSERVDEEVARFEDARAWARARLHEIQRETAQRLGPVEAQIFEPQILMLDDSELLDATYAYIRDNRLSAARAFELRMLELHSEWRRIGHPMVLDRLNDLEDLEVRIVRRLLGMPDPDFGLGHTDEPVVLVARDLTPTITVQLNRASILGIATDAGTRTSHSAILARALKFPCVVSLDNVTDRIRSGQPLILDGRAGRLIVDPSDAEMRLYRERDVKAREWEQELVLLAHLECVTPDQQPILLRGNIDLPNEAATARAHGAEGIGLYRTEFLVVGRNAMPGEDEQYEAYRHVAESFPGESVYIRTFDLGGDKFPHFLNMPAEENPFLGWRAIRVLLDEPELFRVQLRALLRASAHGDIRIMLPMVNELDDVRRTRGLLADEETNLRRDGIAFNPGYKLGVMIETPAAALIAAELTRVSDFFSVGTNDLVQYTVAVDRGNSRLARLYTPFHPAVLKLLRRVGDAGRAAGIEVSVCGEMAANPLGVFLLMGLGYTVFSVGHPALPEIKKAIRSISLTDARTAAARAQNASTSDEVVKVLTEELSRRLDLTLFTGRWNLSPEG